MTEFSPDVPPAEPIIPIDTHPRSPAVELLSDVLGGEGSVLEEQQAAVFSQIIQPIVPFVIDRGLNTARTFHDSETGKVYAADALPVLRRGAATYLVTKSARLHNDPIASSYMLDVARLREADLMRDADGNSAADVLLIQVASKIQTAIDEYQLGGDRKITLCRYGGDEFGITLQGRDWTVEDRRQLTSTIINSVTGINGLPDSLLPVGIKNGALERIDPPPLESLDRDIYDLYAKRGLILDAENIARIREQWPADKARESFERFKLESTHQIYPESIAAASIAEKIQYLRTKHPEFAGALAAAAELDKLIDGNKTTHVEGMAEFIENVVYDQLLGENFYTFDDFQTHVANGIVEQVHVYDLKFIKEVNDNLGLVRGDEIIQEFWENNIKPQIVPDDMDKLILGRRGGTIFIGIRAGSGGYERLSDSAQKLLSGALDEAEISGARLPIGYASSGIAVNQPNFDVRLNDLFKAADKKWYERIALDLAAHAGESESLLGQINRGDKVDLSSLPLKDESGALNLRALITHFLLSKKRAPERQAELRAAIQTTIPAIDVRELKTDPTPPNPKG